MASSEGGILVQLSAHFLTRPHAPALFVRRLQPWRRRPRAVVVLVHGSMVHSEYYLPVALYLANYGFEVWLPDLRGHGRSDGARGHVREFQDHVADVADVYQEAASVADGPLWLAGESYGALLAYLALSEVSPVPQALCLAAPAFALRRAVGSAELRALTWATTLWPTLRSPWATSLDGVVRYRDLPRLVSKDPLLCRRYSVGFLRALLNAQRVAKTQTVPAVPLLMILAGQDGVTHNRSSCEIFEATDEPHALVVYPHAYHAVFTEESANIAWEAWRFHGRLEGRHSKDTSPPARIG